MNTAPSPIFIIGMHRSGTSLLTRLLEDLGLFAGYRKDSNREALLFQSLNRFLLDQAGGRWDRPEPFEDLLREEALRSAALDHVRSVLASPRRWSYLGPRRAMLQGSLKGLDEPWGFKDPRNTFTLPLWQELFSNPYVVHIHRHGVDVAASLRARATERFENRVRWYERLGPVAWAHVPRGRFTETARCMTLEGGFSLWEAYMEEARRHIKHTGDRGVEISYEELLTEPRHVVERVTERIDLNAPEAEIEAATQRIRPDRALAYSEDEELAAFARAHEDRLGIFGYEA